MSHPIYNDTNTCECGAELDPLARCDCKNNTTNQNTNLIKNYENDI